MARTKAFDEQEVLVKAQELFWKKGYHATSITDLTKHLQISKSSIYETFGNKDDLFLKSLNHYLGYNQKRKSINSIAEGGISATLEQFLGLAVERAWSDLERKGCFAVNCTVELAALELVASEKKTAIGSQVKTILNANFEQFVENWALYFKDQQAQGQLSGKKDPQALAQFLFATLSSINLLSRKASDRRVLENIAQTAIEGILA